MVEHIEIDCLEVDFPAPIGDLMPGALAASPSQEYKRFLLEAAYDQTIGVSSPGE